MKERSGIDPLKVLMLGYNGANNTGAEALLQADIEDVRAVFGARATMTVPTLNERNLRRYLSESDDLRIVRIPTLYFGALRRLVRESDVVMLVEGSTYMDTWGSPLLWAFLWATRCAAELGKESLAYAVDAGRLSRKNERRVKSIASRTGQIVARTRAAADRLEAIGVEAPIGWTADNAFTFETRREDEGWVERAWPASQDGLVGIAAVNYACWPVVPRPFGPARSCYKWPYYFSRSADRCRVFDQLASGYARLADRVFAQTGSAVALICMEELDEALAKAIQGRMVRPDAAKIFSARDYDASRMTVLLRSLSLLVTSRFHAAVLSLAARVPQIAVGHDLRLRTLYDDMGLADDWFLDPRAPEGDGIELNGRLFDELEARAGRLIANPGLQSRALDLGYRTHLARAKRNRAILAEFAASRLGLSVGRASDRELAGMAAGGVR
jgi:polysaccharide pyruvyl transferase WcaK-like protein